MNSAGMLAGAMVLMLAVIATAALVGRFSAFYRRELAETAHRDIALDGLRGMAALMVVTHHAFMFNRWLATGEWGNAGPGFLQLLGPAGVTIFFMLTGHLFWGKARAMKGKVNAWKLWRGRLYRIAPLYLFSLLAVLLVAVVQTGGSWLAPANWKSLLYTSALGAIRWQPVGSVELGSYNAYVVWTLWYEWRFYLILPFIAWFACGRRIIFIALALYVMGFTGALFGPRMEISLAFFPGMLCPLLLEGQKLRVLLRHPAAAAVALVLPAVVFACSRCDLLTIPLAGSLFPLFLAAAAGNTFFGFLTHPAVRCLGAISFSLYLLHAIIFRVVVSALKTAGLTTLPLLQYWLLITLTAAAITLLCAVTYRWIEFPFLSRSHKVKVGQPA